MTFPNKDRLKIGLLFNFQPTWMGGITYILNLIKTFNYLSEEEKPDITLYYSEPLKKYIGNIDYPHITFVPYPEKKIAKGYLMSWLKRKNLFTDELIERDGLDAIYPVRDCPVKSRTKARVIAWYADLQHKIYPEFFTRSTLLHRTLRLNLMLRNATDMVVSSRAVKDDFDRFFKIRKQLGFHIYHFVSINDEFKSLDINELRKKYELPEKYFMVSNQFHKHKNHKVVLLALARLKEQGIHKHLAFTGRFPSATDSPYLAELHQIINHNNLHSQISLLGIIPRNDQMQLMNHCQAVVQPSLFEGWSTVIEDAKSLQVPVIASDLKVNMEQLEDKGEYFKPHDYKGLASMLANFPDRNKREQIYPPHTERVKGAARELLNIFKP
ncbi:Glycosyltransferase involved in cell wall bisynthesis [Saccharicrinis carchari]|uniref:Glycosyltransferase involved in cell wall bisynthesis n=1 Tax=Saccharicrinis carchari TaxID=1168039 RepID=A0A521BTE0_SACCC|nr:glycosyltransferase family 1 protein [Saccharicrinis carchari]SMO50434.1 Glycosyltransferase involved in cell wall bisynthesis [Saccharicrinis carchari]